MCGLAGLFLPRQANVVDAGLDAMIAATADPTAKDPGSASTIAIKPDLPGSPSLIPRPPTSHSSKAKVMARAC